MRDEDGIMRSFSDTVIATNREPNHYLAVTKPGVFSDAAQPFFDYGPYVRETDFRAKSPSVVQHYWADGSVKENARVRPDSVYRPERWIKQADLDHVQRLRNNMFSDWGVGSHQVPMLGIDNSNSRDHGVVFRHNGRHTSRALEQEFPGDNELVYIRPFNEEGHNVGKYFDPHPNMKLTSQEAFKEDATLRPIDMSRRAPDTYDVGYLKDLLVGLRSMEGDASFAEGGKVSRYQAYRSEDDAFGRMVHDYLNEKTGGLYEKGDELMFNGFDKAADIINSHPYINISPEERDESIGTPGGFATGLMYPGSLAETAVSYAPMAAGAAAGVTAGVTAPITLGIMGAFGLAHTLGWGYDELKDYIDNHMYSDFWERYSGDHEEQITPAQLRQMQEEQELKKKNNPLDMRKYYGF
jgi:hypothetical protein